MVVLENDYRPKFLKHHQTVTIAKRNRSTLTCNIYHQSFMFSTRSLGFFKNQHRNAREAAGLERPGDDKMAGVGVGGGVRPQSKTGKASAGDSSPQASRLPQLQEPTCPAAVSLTCPSVQALPPSPLIRLQSRFVPKAFWRHGNICSHLA